MTLITAPIWWRTALLQIAVRQGGKNQEKKTYKHVQTQSSVHVVTEELITGKRN